MDAPEVTEQYAAPVESNAPEPPLPSGGSGGNPYPHAPPPNRSRSPYRGRERNRSRSRSPPRRRSRSPPYRGRRRSQENDEHPRGGPAGRVENEPLESYKAFMMRQEDNVSPEVCLQRYEDYKKRVLVKSSRSFFDAHKMEEWLQERYSPAIRHRQLQQTNSKKRAEAKAFNERVKTMHISFDETPGDAAQPQPDFFNDMEESARLLYIRRIPCSCPFSVLSEAIAKHGVFQDLLLSDPVKKKDMDFERSAYILYESASAAAEAMPKLQNLLVEAPEIPHPLRLQVMIYRTRAPLKTPSYMSLPDRIAYDFNQALYLAKLLDQPSVDEGHGIASILASLDESSSERRRLDITIAYLRRVHHFIYYAGVQCLDMGDVMHAYPALFIRPAATDRDLEDDKSVSHKAFSVEDGTIAPGAGWGAWSVSLDERIEAQLKLHVPSVVVAKQQEDLVLVQDIEAREELALEPVYNSYTEKAGDDGKHRCLLCTKLFKSLEFVKKHIRNKHPELVVEKIFSAGETFMWDQYREDPDRPMDPIVMANQPVLRPAYDRRDNYGRGGGGGYRQPPHYDGGRGGGFRGGWGGRGGGGYPPQQNYPRRFDGPRQPPPRSDRPLPVDPRQVSTSYQDLDSVPAQSVDLDFQDALGSLPPPKKLKKDE
ncbi:Aste57867_23078 [Aphanomyces stellatus]|uniref:Aste57867_23078 protein n=1 Tax=Aphanomyces stellatus TaxID=120398 RepID=A0A485LM87_9STRA|nr:hypothetical protein As57867_023007 [Aphanomyces stellatus]VFT99726.1 Aste57867_23078 [Aphanomyces stellatus]